MTFLLMMFEDGACGNFLGAIAITPAAFGLFFDVFVHPLFFRSDALQVLFPRHINLPFHAAVLVPREAKETNSHGGRSDAPVRPQSPPRGHRRDGHQSGDVGERFIRILGGAVGFQTAGATFLEILLSRLRSMESKRL